MQRSASSSCHMMQSVLLQSQMLCSWIFCRPPITRRPRPETGTAPRWNVRLAFLQWFAGFDVLFERSPIVRADTAHRFSSPAQPHTDTRMRILVLGGTGEASALAQVLGRRTDLDTILS